MGQLVGVVDPYRIAKGDASGLRCSINPLAAMNPESLTIRADLEALGDGLIRRFDPKHGQWDNAAAAICAGLADYVLANPPERRTLLEVRKLLLLPDDVLQEMAQEMATTATSAGLAKHAGALLLNKFSNPEGVPAAAFNRALEETGWIDDPAFAAVLGGDALPAFDLSTLKAATGSLYLCIPPGYLDVRGGFLRLFVRMGLMTMMRDLADHGGKTGRCLFLLDEFHSLGKVDLVAKAAGLMRGYGVQLWPFLQDLGQLEALYGRAEGDTFFGNSDAHIFFGNTDARTLDYISGRIGNLTPDEVQAGPPKRTDYFSDHSYENASAKYQHDMRLAGTPRLRPDEVRELVAKPEDFPTSRNMIVFARGKDVLSFWLRPYFLEKRFVAFFAEKIRKKRDRIAAFVFYFCCGVGGIIPVTVLYLLIDKWEVLLLAYAVVFGLQMAIPSSVYDAAARRLERLVARLI